MYYCIASGVTTTGNSDPCDLWIRTRGKSKLAMRRAGEDTDRCLEYHASGLCCVKRLPVIHCSGLRPARQNTRL